MIPRYTRPEMAAIWTDQARFEHMLRVEVASLHALAASGVVPAEAVAAIEERGRVDVDRIAELEKVTDHDVVAFVNQVAETVGEGGRYLHFGLTSSDVVDTALALQCREAADLLLTELDALVGLLATKAREHAGTGGSLRTLVRGGARCRARALWQGSTGLESARRGCDRVGSDGPPWQTSVLVEQGCSRAG